MQKTTFGLLAIICALLPPLTAGAQGKQGTKGIYGSLSAGLAIPSDIGLENALIVTNATIETGLGFGVTAAVGYDFGNGPRVEFEIGYAGVGVDNVTGTFLGSPITALVSEEGIDVWTFMINGYYTWPLAPTYSLWAGGGVGLGSVSGDILFDAGFLTGVSLNSGTVFALNGQFGADFDIGNNLMLSPYYRLTWVNSGDDILFDNYISHSIFVGVRYMFGAM